MLGEQEIEIFTTDLKYCIGTFVSIAAITLLLIFGTIFKIFNKPLGPMVLVVCISDLLFCLLKCNGFVFKHPSDLYCKIMASITQIFFVLSMTWSVFFAHSLYTVMKFQSLDAITVNFKYYSLISAVIAGTFGIAMPFTDFVVYSNEKCLHIITNGRADITFSAFTTFPMMVCCALAIYWYAKTGGQLKQKGFKIDNHYVLTLLAYPGIIILCVFPLVVYDAMNWFGDYQSHVGKIVLGNLWMLMGALDAFVYGLLPQLRGYCRKRSPTEKSDQLLLDDIVSSNTLLQEGLSSMKSQQTLKSRAVTDFLEESKIKKKIYIQARSYERSTSELQ